MKFLAGKVYRAITPRSNNGIIHNIYIAKRLADNKLRVDFLTPYSEPQKKKPLVWDNLVTRMIDGVETSIDERFRVNAEDIGG